MRHLALSVVVAAAAAQWAAAAEPGQTTPPDMTAFWRSFFARPANIPHPPDAPMTPERVALGQRLFFDTLLSADETRACASCHDPARAFTDGRARAAARDGSDLDRNAPGLQDLAWGKSFMWDGRAATLETQAAMPIEHPRELAGSWSTIVQRIKQRPDLDVAFHGAFAERPAAQPATIVKALAAYVRSLRSPENRFDRWVKGNDDALSPREKEGFHLFVGRAGCVGCHGTWRFTDDRFHDIGLPGTDPGRGAVAGGIPGLAAFKTPSLRDLTRTAPYMHDGSLSTLEAVVDHYSDKLIPRASLDTSVVRNLKLDAEDKARLVAFLKTLSSE